MGLHKLKEALKGLLPHTEPITLPQAWVAGIKLEVQLTLTCDAETLSEKQRKANELLQPLAELTGANGFKVIKHVILEQPEENNG